MNAAIMRDLESGAWSAVDPDDCPCHGNGWLLSDFDTLHRCPVHGKGVPYPEDEGDGVPFNYAEHKLLMYRQAYLMFENDARHCGFNGNFKEACRSYLKTTSPTPQDWVEVAKAIASDLIETRRQAAAKAMGYSCALEAEWAEEAGRERANNWAV